MTSRPNDRQIVEQMLLPAALTSIVTIMLKEFGNDEGKSQELERANHLLGVSLQEPVANIASVQVAKLVRRTKRATIEALTPLFEKYPLATQYLTLAYLVAELANEDYIKIGAQSPFAEAWDIMTEVMDCVVDKLPEMDKIATVEATALRQRLEASGYFRG